MKLIRSHVHECQGSMRVIAFIENEDVIKKILKHLGLVGGKAETQTKG